MGGSAASASGALASAHRVRSTGCAPKEQKTALDWSAAPASGALTSACGASLTTAWGRGSAAASRRHAQNRSWCVRRGAHAKFVVFTSDGVLARRRARGGCFGAWTPVKSAVGQSRQGRCQGQSLRMLRRALSPPTNSIGQWGRGASRPYGQRSRRSDKLPRILKSSKS